MKVTISFSKWNRGAGAGCGVFFDGTCYCAMGFVLKACGLSDKELKDKGSFADLPIDALTKVPHELFDVIVEGKTGYALRSTVATQITDTNDTARLKDGERMDLLKLYLEPIGFDLDFIDDTRA